MATSDADALAHDTDSASAGASPYATGGGGTRLEHRLACVFLGHLPSGALVHELGERPPTKVALQQAHATSVDDIVVDALAADGVSSVRLEIAVRRRPRFVPSDKSTVGLIAALVRADLAAERETDPLVEHRLAVAVSGHQSHTAELAELALLARDQSNADDFFTLLRVPRKFAVRPRLDHLLAMVSAALADVPERGVGTPEARCWSLLRRLWVMPLELEAGNERHWTTLADELRPVAIRHSRDAAVALRDRLEQLAGELARSAGSLDAPGLRRRLHGEIDPDAHERPVGWTRLRSLDTEARSIVARSITGAGATDLVLPRQAIRDALADGLSSGRDLLVHGDSGVGKSALVMDAVDPDRLGPERQAIAINLRHLPSTPLELEALLIDPPGTLLDELMAPGRWLVIDAAEGAAEGHGQMLSHLVRIARAAGFAVIVVATSDGAGSVRERLSGGTRELHELEIPGLDDAELDEVAAHVPALQRLVDDARARELLRRPIIIDLLGRAGNPGLPLNESQALEPIWQHLVRRGGHPDRGSPDARERTMLHLAAHAVRGGDVDDLWARLDPVAVDDLRRTDLLLPASALPWERVPAFKHDLVRAYAVARFLLRERDPAAALLADGAPRWALPSARLACQILLSVPDIASYPRRGRFAALQHGFDVVAARGGGQRWADVPSEALLTVSEPEGLLEEAWPTLVGGDAHGLARLIRVLNGRHRRQGVLDLLVAEPMIARVLATDRPENFSAQIGELTLDWLQARALRGTPAGNELRVRLRERILRRCAENEAHLDAREAARRQALAERTPEKVAADEDRRRRLARHAAFSGSHASRGLRSRPATDRHSPRLWIGAVEIECLALLGPDLDARGEAVLRRIAEDEPDSLIHAVEAPLAGFTLASHDPKLLVDLVAAYYIETEKEDDGHEIFVTVDRLGDGIRRHRYRGWCSPEASYLHGPFLALFRADYFGGIDLLNRLLDHGARCRARALSSLRDGSSPERGLGGNPPVVLGIAGEPREFVGDPHVWSWYRGTGVGPEPCTSALQALEFVTEECVRVGVPPQLLAARMIDGAHNLAMPALALGVLVRHLGVVGDAVDPYLVEPLVWDLELSRVTGERLGAPAASVPDLANPERRLWGLREVSTMLTLRAEGERVEQLKALGEKLEVRGRAGAFDRPLDSRRHRLATVRRWAASLDRQAYEVTQKDGATWIGQVADPETEQALRASDTNLERTGEAAGLFLRHVLKRGACDGERALDGDVLAADLVTARALEIDPPRDDMFAIEAPVAVAASAVELHLGSGVRVGDEDLSWSAAMLVKVANGVAPDERDDLDRSMFGQGVGRSVSRALPFLLLPEARDLRAAVLGREGVDPDRFVAMHHAVAVNSGTEARLAYARALDVVWAAPCDTEHLFGRCHHEIAFELVTASFVESVIGSWDPATWHRPMHRLDPPEASSLDGVDGDDIHAPRLVAALRATGAAAISSACCAHRATKALPWLIAAHQRAMTAHEYGYHHSHSDALVAARAALWQATDGDDETVLRYVAAYLSDSRVLAEALQAIAVAAEERPDAARHACRLWPRIMDIVLDAAQADPKLFTARTWGGAAESALIPNPGSRSRYLTVEIRGEPCPWRDLLAWSPQVDRWLDTISPSRRSVDHLVVAVGELDVAAQVEQGLRWIERIVSGDADGLAHTYTLPRWLRERRADLVGEGQLGRWQRIVDRLVVAGDDRVSDLAD